LIPNQREVLGSLSKARLLELARQFDLEATTQLPKGKIVDVLARSRRASYRRVLETLRTEELKAICQSFGLADGGREKAQLVDRILGNGVAAAGNGRGLGAASQKMGRGKGSNSRIEVPAIEGQLRQADLPFVKHLQLTQSQLESHLWEAANILRGSPVDRTDWKAYILPLLFFKRISDVWDEEVQAIVGEYGDPQLAAFPESHRFQVLPNGPNHRGG
jgi:type I restriction enzyme M protein